MLSIDAVGGFDKEMGILLTRDKISVAYAEKGIIYDEKVSNPEMFKKQRRRWLSAQFALLGKYWASGLKGLLAGQRDHFNEVYQLSILPRVMMLGLMPILLGISALLPGVGPAWELWLAATVCCYSGILIGIPASLINEKFWGALLRVPMIFITMFLLLFKLKGANKKFIHTPHIHNAEQSV